MLRKSAYLLSAAACTMLITSCGGGGGTATPTPSPSATATASPSPSPTPTTQTLDFAHDLSMASALMYISAYFTPSGGTETFSDASRQGQVGSFAYTAASKTSLFTYPDGTASTYPDGTTTKDFDATTLTSSSASELDYLDPNSGFKLVVQVPYGNVLQAIYERTDSYTKNTVNGTLRSDRVGLFYNPVLITSAFSSSLSYTGNVRVVGGTPGTTTAGDVSAPAATFTIDTSGALTGTIPIHLGTGGSQTTDTTMSFSATVDPTTNAFTGTLSDSGDGFSGAFAGTLAGPNREEMALVFSVTNTDGRKYVGSFIGRQ